MRIEEFINTKFDLIKQYWKQQRVEFMSDKFLYMFLYLCTKLFMITDKKFQQLTYKSESIKDYNLLERRFLYKKITKKHFLKKM